MSKKRAIISYDKLTIDQKKQILKDFPDGYINHLTSIKIPTSKFPMGEMMEALIWETDEVIYLVKINKSIPKPAAILDDEEDDFDDEELEKNIGRYIRFKKQKEWQKLGLLVNMGMIFEIVAIQKHWGHVDGKYVPNKIGYRVAEVGEERDFGRVGDIDEIDFVNLTEDEATKINKEIHSNFENGIFPKWYYKS